MKKADSLSLFNVYMLGFGQGGGLLDEAVEIPFTTEKRTSISDFEGFGRITTIQYGLTKGVFNYGVINLPNGKQLGPSFGYYSGLAWQESTYVVLTYWDQIGPVENLW